MQVTNHESRPVELSPVTLAWAFDDQDAPTELTIFDPGVDITTRWITIDADHVRDLDEIA